MELLEQNIWWMVAGLLSLLTASYVYVNQFVKVKGSQLMVYRGLGTFLLLLPFSCFFEPINNCAFFVLCVVQGFVISYGDNRILNSAKTFGAEITSVIHPLSIAIIFLFWLLLHPENFLVLSGHPLHFSIISLSLIGISVSIILICNSKISRKALKFLFLGMLCEVFIDVTNKETTILGAENIISAIFYYTLVTSFVAGISNLLFYFHNNKKLPQLLAKKNFKVIVFFVSYAIVHSMLKTYAMYKTPNPAYVAAIVHAYPVWIILANNLYQLKNPNYKTNKLNKWHLFLLLICMLGLVLTVHED